MIPGLETGASFIIRIKIQMNNRYRVTIRPYLYIVSKTTELRDIIHAKIKMLLPSKNV
jgi:hypothetical protein